ncbi:hypothetical protein ACQP25_44350 (plasmid) [Microtetraspora malaysiensis]|uniref:hypothetical protein n=1 Tax=Microtetraspora malaysiensis TaxID=161358 RepID=UPI003D8F0835
MADINDTPPVPSGEVKDVRLTDRVQTRVTPEVAAWLLDRSARMHTGSNHLQAKIELSLWRDAMAAELRRIRLTVEQACCLADVLNGHMMSPGIAYGAGLVFAECYDAFDIASGYSTYGKKWNIDEAALLDLVMKLGPVADHALMDAFARWWNLYGSQAITNYAETFKAVGIRITPDPDADDAELSISN